MIMKKENSVVYVTPESVCIDVVIEGVLCSSLDNGEVEGGDNLGDA